MYLKVSNLNQFSRFFTFEIDIFKLEVDFYKNWIYNI